MLQANEAAVHHDNEYKKERADKQVFLKAYQDASA
jgi:hypothetical protein